MGLPLSQQAVTRQLSLAQWALNIVFVYKTFKGFLIGSAQYLYDLKNYNFRGHIFKMSDNIIRVKYYKFYNG